MHPAAPAFNMQTSVATSAAASLAVAFFAPGARASSFNNMTGAHQTDLSAVQDMEAGEIQKAIDLCDSLTDPQRAEAIQYMQSNQRAPKWMLNWSVGAQGVLAMRLQPIIDICTQQSCGESPLKCILWFAWKYCRAVIW